MEPITAEGRLLLDNVYDELAGASSASKDLIEKLFRELRDMRLKASPREWKTFVKEVVPKHPLKEFLHQDPFSRHSFEKPRGYAGDAELLDYIYGDSKANISTEYGQMIFEYTTNAPASRAVRYRRDLIATMIDQLAEEKEAPRILSLACGHLREAHLSKAVQEGRIKEYLAIDQDAQSLSVVATNFSGLKVTPLRHSVRDFIAGRHLDTLGTFDFIYAAGLYDYLPQPHAQKLTKCMFDRLQPEGKLLIANFLPDIPDVGYMETFMAWQLIYRNRSELFDVSALIPDSAVREEKAFIEDNQSIIFLEMVKK